MENPDKIMDFFIELEKFKETQRFSESPAGTGDTSASHSWKLAFMALSVAKELKLELDLFRTVKICLVHDLPEYITGDIDSRRIARGEFSKDDKTQAEQRAIDEIEKKAGSFGKEIKELWQEYEAAASQEARFVKALDKIETLSHQIHAGGESCVMPEHVATYADKAVNNFPELKPFLNTVKEKLKKTYEEAGLEWKPEYNS